MSGSHWQFSVAGDVDFERLAEAVRALREAKLTGDWRDLAYWGHVFCGCSVAWGVDFLVERFEEGEFVLIGLRRDDLGTGGLGDIGIEPLDYGYLDFEPYAVPYSGDCMGELIEAFGHRDGLNFGP